jgi:hypothetical protein
MSHWHPQIEPADQSRAHHERWRSSHAPAFSGSHPSGSIEALLEDRFTEWCNESFVALSKNEGNR